MTASPPTFAQMIQGLESMSPEQLKAVLPAGPSNEELAVQFPEIAAVEVLDVDIDGGEGKVPARSYRASGEQAGAGFVWAHGGGFVAGDLDMPEANWVALMVAARGVPVLSIDYRKCLRGVRYPAPSDDVLAAWQWAEANAASLGTTADNLHLGGASAGANLVAGVTKRLRDGAGTMPRSLVLVYPLLHKALPPASDELRAALAATPSIFTPEVVDGFTRNFVDNAEAFDDPYAFAANGDVSGQPPVFILNSEADGLRASGEAYADALRAAGVRVTLELEPNTVHGHLNEPDTPEASKSIERIVRWIESHRTG